MNEPQPLDPRVAAIGSEIVGYYRKHPEDIPEGMRTFINGFQVALDASQRNIAEADAAERREKYAEWKELFLRTRRSPLTRKAYGEALARLEKFCEKESMHPSEMDYEKASLFAISPTMTTGSKRTVRAPASVRRDIAACSAFYSELYKLSKGGIQNPFFRLAGKPDLKTNTKRRIPTDKELSIITTESPGKIRAAVSVMALRGLRIGALQGLHLATRKGKTTFRTFSKGRPQSGTMPKDAMIAIESAGLSRVEPFSGTKTNTLEKQVERELRRLALSGKISDGLSCHSFRHYYAVRQYAANKDIEAVRRLLNHASIATTQTYLRELGAAE